MLNYYTHHVVLPKFKPNNYEISRKLNLLGHSDLKSFAFKNILPIYNCAADCLGRLQCGILLFLSD